MSDSKGNKYFKDRKIPEQLLYEYNKMKGNIDIDKTDYTFKEVFEEFKQKYFPTKEEMQIESETHIKQKGKFGKSTANNLKSAYNKCVGLQDRLYKSLRKEDFEAIILNTTGCGTVINSLANLFKKLDNYALEHDIICKGYANLIKITEDLYVPTQNGGTPYTYEEIEKIWAHEGKLVADITLLTIYTGARIEELLFAKNNDIYIKDKYFVAGLKTNAGKRRIIPIHEDILPIIKKYMSDKEFLFTIDNKKIDYNKQFLKMYRAFMEELGMQHKTHDGRKTLHSELDRVKANTVCVDKIFGHKSGNIGQDVYTKKSIQELIQTINLVRFKGRKKEKITYLDLSKIV